MKKFRHYKFCASPTRKQFCHKKLNKIPFFSFFYRWDAKLGYHRYPSLPTTLKKLVSSGGYASELTLFLARKYPIVYQLDSKKYISQRNYDSLKIDQDLEQIYQEVQAQD